MHFYFVTMKELNSYEKYYSEVINAVQMIVEKYISKIGLDTHKYTTHKLRHTAATLMYQSGVDIRALQEILGHEQLSTTEIYTHVNNDMLKAAVDSNPLAEVTFEKEKDNNKDNEDNNLSSI